MNRFKILSVNISDKKSVRKTPVSSAKLIENYGIENDAHSGVWDRQVSFLAREHIDEMRAKGLTLNFGDFGENITTAGIDFENISIGTILYLGEAELEVTIKGKTCHAPCEIFKQVGDCIMPKYGIFARVLKGGLINNESHCYYDI